MHDETKAELARLSLRQPLSLSRSPNVKQSSSPSLSSIETKVTRLSNGLRVVTENRPGLSCTIGCVQ